VITVAIMVAITVAVTGAIMGAKKGNGIRCDISARHLGTAFGTTFGMTFGTTYRCGGDGCLAQSTDESHKVFIEFLKVIAKGPVEIVESAFWIRRITRESFAESTQVCHIFFRLALQKVKR
jgi:hypothetical protein